MTIESRNSLVWPFVLQVDPALGAHFHLGKKSQFPRWPFVLQVLSELAADDAGAEVAIPSLAFRAARLRGKHQGECYGEEKSQFPRWPFVLQVGSLVAREDVRVKKSQFPRWPFVLQDSPRSCSSPSRRESRNSLVGLSCCKKIYHNPLNNPFQKSQFPRWPFVLQGEYRGPKQIADQKSQFPRWPFVLQECGR